MNKKYIDFNACSFDGCDNEFQVIIHKKLKNWFKPIIVLIDGNVTKVYPFYYGWLQSKLRITLRKIETLKLYVGTECFVEYEM